MFGNRLAASLAIAIFLIGYPLALWAEELLNVETWPNDVTCKILKKHPDGTYEITVPWTRFFQTHTGTKYRNTRETKYWDQKCKGQTL